MLSKETKQLFLAAYKEVCLKYGIVIDACTCCDGPKVVILNESEDYCRAHYRFSKLRGIESHIEHLNTRDE